MRRLLATVSVLAVGAVAALPAAGSAYAAPAQPADLQVLASQVSGHIGESVQVRLILRNNGPNSVPAGSFELAITAPPGTRFAGGSALSGNCDQGDRNVRCRYDFGLRRGDRHELNLGLRIEAQPSGCGRVSTNYAMDPRDRNNTMNIRVVVGGLPRSCSGSQTSPTPKASKSPLASATPEAGEITDAPPQDTPASAEALPAVPASDNGGGMSLAGILVIGGGLLLVALGGLLIWRLLRREPEDGYEEDPRPAAPTAWNTQTAQWDAGPTRPWNVGPAPTQQWNAGPTQQWDAGPPPPRDAGPPQQWDAGPTQRPGGRHSRRPDEYPPGDDTGPIYGR